MEDIGVATNFATRGASPRAVRSCRNQPTLGVGGFLLPPCSCPVIVSELSPTQRSSLWPLDSGHSNLRPNLLCVMHMCVSLVHLHQTLILGPQTHTLRIIVKEAMCEHVRLANYKAVLSNPDNSAGLPLLIPFGAFDTVEQMGEGPYRDLPCSTRLWSLN